MKCQKCEEAILLERSGELGRGRRRRLQRHLAQCAHCRRYQQELAQITRAELFPAGACEVSAFTLHRIREQARRAAVQPHQTVWIPPFMPGPAWKNALAAVAAVLVIVISGVTLRHRMQADSPVRTAQQGPAGMPAEWGDALDRELDALDAELTLTASLLQDESLYDPWESADAEDMAEQLLALEESS
jgi:anti-sigma factor RsiW